MACAGKCHSGTDALGAPRDDGKNRQGKDELEQQLNYARVMEDVLGVCHSNSNVSSRNSRQREEVDGIMIHFGTHSSSVGCTSTTASVTSASSAPMFDVTNSQLRFMEPDQTIIIFDWDDTLCPSTWMRRHCASTRGSPSSLMKGAIEEETALELEHLSNQVIPLLRGAQAMGKVVLVTNAKRPWVSTSCARFIPKVQEQLKGIDIIYAMEFLGDQQRITNETLIESKARAMKSAVSDFYSKYERQSWKNLISIGDAHYEHEAIRQVARERPGGVLPEISKKCRTKTVKFIESPTISGIVLQLSLLENWLAKVILTDGDIAIDMAGAEADIKHWMDAFGNAESLA